MKHYCLTYCPPTCWSFRIGLNENANSFFATRCRFWSSKNSGFPCNAVHKAALTVLTNPALSGITGMMKWKWDRSNQSPQISVTQRRGLKKSLTESFGSRWASKVKINAYKTMKVFFDLACMSTCCWGLPTPNCEPYILYIYTVYIYIYIYIYVINYGKSCQWWRKS